MAAVAGSAACTPEVAGGVGDGPEAAAATELDTATVLAIAAEFGIRKGMTEACDGTDPDRLAGFLAELRALETDPLLVREAERVSDDMYEMARVEEPEYVCTPEMYESSTQRAAKAEADWSDLRKNIE